MSCQIPVLGSWVKKHLTRLKSVTIHVISVSWKSGWSLLTPLLVSVYITPHQLGTSWCLHQRQAACVTVFPWDEGLVTYAMLRCRNACHSVPVAYSPSTVTGCTGLSPRSSGLYHTAWVYGKSHWCVNTWFLITAYSKLTKATSALEYTCSVLPIKSGPYALKNYLSQENRVRKQRNLTQMGIWTDSSSQHIKGLRDLRGSGLASSLESGAVSSTVYKGMNDWASKLCIIKRHNCSWKG